MTRSAEAEAERRAENDTVNDGNTGSKATAGGDDWSANKAYDRMMSKNRDTLLNCSLTTMSVGRGTAEYEHCTLVLHAAPTRTRASAG